MDKTNINVLVQSIEHSLHLIYKNLFSIKQYQFPPKVTPDSQQMSWWGATGSGGRTTECAANEDETRPWQYHLSKLMFSSAAAGVMNTVSVFFLAWARKKWIPISRWSLCMMGCQPT